MADAHHDEHAAPVRTTPQGYQFEGVEPGHEEADVDLRQLWQGFIGLGVFLVASIIVSLGLYKIWEMVPLGRTELPSAMFAVEKAPPQPRLLPNPVDHPEKPTEAIPGPGENLVHERKLEAEKLAGYGLLNSAGDPRLPPEAAAAARAEGQPAGSTPNADQAWAEEMPSDSSGGTATENRLK